MVSRILILKLQETDLPLWAPGGFVKVRFLDLLRCSENDPQSIDLMLQEPDLLLCAPNGFLKIGHVIVDLSPYSGRKGPWTHPV